MLKEIIFAAAILAETVFMIYRLVKNRRSLSVEITPVAVAVPLVTLMLMLLVMDEPMESGRELAFYALLVMINIAMFAVNEINILRGIELQRLISHQAERDAELEMYRLIREKYENTRIMRHDFKEQINALRALIDEDSESAKSCVRSLDESSRELDFAEYTDNKILNILLAKKASECRSRGINMYVKSTGAKLSFLSETDTVAIFSNLINNAAEAASASEEKNVFIDFDTMNEAFTVIRAENNCDFPPAEENGSLITKKSNANAHGIGIKSIKSSLKRYGGRMNWKYDEENKFFRTVIILENGGECDEKKL